jgi:CHAT domain-containing protein
VYSYIAAIHPAGLEEIARNRRAGLESGDEAVIGEKLRQLIFDPIAPHLKPATRLRIAPDGALGAVAFALLPLEGGARLIDKFEVSYLSCGRALLRQPPSGGGDAGPPVVVCDPDFDLADLSAALAKAGSPPGFYFERLPHTALEGEQVHARLGGEVLAREAATRAEMLAVKSPAILRLTVRGDVLSSSDDPLVRDGLALAGVNGWPAGHTPSADAGDGLLASLDIAHLDLRKTELVFLSSCSSARGTVRPGEGSAGILQSFEAAGARRTVAALWAMPDHPATVTLIDRFYARVLAGDGVPAALRRAQRELKQLGAPPWAWGALVAYGDVAPLQWRPGE